MSLTKESEGEHESLEELDRAEHLKKSAINLQETLVRTCSPFIAGLLSEVYSELTKLGVDINSILLVHSH